MARLVGWCSICRQTRCWLVVCRLVFYPVAKSAFRSVWSVGVSCPSAKVPYHLSVDNSVGVLSLGKYAVGSVVVDRSVLYPWIKVSFGPYFRSVCRVVPRGTCFTVASFGRCALSCASKRAGRSLSLVSRSDNGPSVAALSAGKIIIGWVLSVGRSSVCR